MQAPLNMGMGRGVPMTSYVCSALQSVTRHQVRAWLGTADRCYEHACQILDVSGSLGRHAASDPLDEG